MRRNRKQEINIFSMSALDLFASALGAFILIAIVALPYYLNTDKHKYNHKNIGNISAKNKFFIITMYWIEKQKQDIDLIIKDPSGRIYSYKHKSYKGIDAKLIFDAVNVKNGLEMWTNYKVSQKGTWEIYYSNYSGNKNIKVYGALYTNTGTYKFPIHIMSGKVKKKVANISLGSISSNVQKLKVEFF